MKTLINIELDIKRIFNVLELDNKDESSLNEYFNKKHPFEFTKRGKAFTTRFPLENGNLIKELKPLNDGLFFAELNKDGNFSFLEITLLNSDFSDFYIMIISDMIFRSFETNYNFELILERYYSWREFIKLINVPKTDLGLWGELKFLEFVLDNQISNVHSWTGPEFSTHDFKIDNRFFEIKTTSNKYKNLISINGMLQLNSNEDTALCFIRVEKDNSLGESLKDLIIKISKKINSPDHAVFEKKYSRFNKIIDSSSDKFKIAVNHIYLVDDNFPKISQNSFKNDKVPKGISYISYTVDLSNLDFLNLNEYFKVN